MSKRRSRRGDAEQIRADREAVAAAREDALAELGEALGYDVDAELLDQALTHRSYAIENEGTGDYERLELLGDSVLGFVVTDELYRRHPDAPERTLARMRQAVVCTSALAEVGRTLGVGACMRLGHGEHRSGGAEKPGILADVVEAIIAAIYLDGGQQPAKEFIVGAFGPLMSRAAELGPALDWKSSLQERAGELGLAPPRYDVVADGPDNERVFEAVVWLGDEPLGRGTGSNKKAAEVGAAAEAYQALAERPG